MAKLIYSAIASLDGYIEDEHGKFDWAAPDAEVHHFVNDMERPIGTYLYGRRMYETMVYWETARSERPADAATTRRSGRPRTKSSTRRRWRTCRAPARGSSGSFDPAAVRQLKSDADRDLSVGGPGLAAHALQAGLVDECHLFLHPVTVGGGKPALPAGVRLELLDERRFESGVVFLSYRVV